MRASDRFPSGKPLPERPGTLWDRFTAQKRDICGEV